MNIVNEHETIYKNEQIELCKQDGEFYKVDYLKQKVTKISVESLVLIYCIETKNNYFLNMVLAFMRVYSKLLGVNKDYIQNSQDLDDLAEVYFKNND